MTEKFAIDFLAISKYHGIGNDYIIINDEEYRIPEEKKSLLAKKLCERYYSVGADGLIFVGYSDKYDIKMRIFNSDGSEAEMCGNGIRCFSKHIYEMKIIEKPVFKVETLKGVIIPELIIENGVVQRVKVNIGPPILECEKIPVIPHKDQKQCISEQIQAGDRTYDFSAVSMGNPHAVIFKEKELDAAEVEKYGGIIETHERFPKKTNVEFVKVISKREAYLKVFERGVGITKACGTGACAAVVAGTILEKFDKNKPITIHMNGGDLVINYSKEGVFMEGPVERVFSGQIDHIEI
jgi:diaminopimelate epimerase